MVGARDERTRPLDERIRERSAEALACGALQPIPTRSDVIRHDGIPFLVRVTEAFEKKLEAAARRPGVNPFLPYDEAMYVAELGESHVCLLNKYKVVDQHVLIVTREFEEQTSALTLRDFEASWRVLAEIGGLVFYNAGVVAGASQSHKHLQQVPLPLGAGPEATPIDAVLAGTTAVNGVASAALPFPNALARHDARAVATPKAAAAASFELYREMLLREGCGPSDQPRPYNLLMTREWLLLIPRHRASFASIEVNALGFAGALLVRGEEPLAWLREHGPPALLRAVSTLRA